MFYTVWGALSSTSVWIKSFNPSVLSPTFHWNQLSSDFLSLANGFKQHVGGGERLRWSFWESLFSPISYMGTMWKKKKNQPATLTSIFKTLALWSSTTVTVYNRIFGYTTLSTLVSKRKVYQTRYTSAKMCSAKFPSFVLKGNLWISQRLICLLSDDSSWSFYPTSFLAVTCFVWEYEYLFAYKHEHAPSPPSHVTLSAICWQLPCCFVYFTSPCICSICICMSKRAHTHKCNFLQLPCTSDDTFPFECYGCRLETQTHSQK